MDDRTVRKEQLLLDKGRWSDETGEWVSYYDALDAMEEYAKEVAWKLWLYNWPHLYSRFTKFEDLSEEYQKLEYEMFLKWYEENK